MTDEEFYKAEQELLMKLVEHDRIPPTKESLRKQDNIKSRIRMLNNYYKEKHPNQ